MANEVNRRGETEVKTVSLQKKNWRKIDALAKRMNLNRSRVVDVLVEEALAEQAVADFLVGGPQNFDRMMRVLRWLLDVEKAETPEQREVDTLKAVLS